MKKAALALTTLAALTVTTVAVAQQPKEEAPTSTTPAGSTQAAPGGSTTSPAQPGAQGGPISPQGQVQQQGQMPSGPIPPATPSQQTSTTTITAAESTTPAPLELPPARDTITVRESFRPNRSLLYTGGTMFLSSYAATAALTATQNIRDGNGDQSLYIPAAGPWMHLANTSESPLNTALIAGSGVVQGVGLVLGALSLIIPEKVPVATIQAGGVKMTLTAASYGRGSAGVGAVGQF